MAAPVRWSHDQQNGYPYQIWPMRWSHDQQGATQCHQAFPVSFVPALKWILRVFLFWKLTSGYRMVLSNNGSSSFLSKYTTPSTDELLQYSMFGNPPASTSNPEVTKLWKWPNAFATLGDSERHDVLWTRNGQFILDNWTRGILLTGNGSFLIHFICKVV